ncbi:MAG: hypothetical protein ACKOT0_04515 [bacterium]
MHSRSARARTALVAAVAVAGAFGLAACEKPAPGISVFSGTTSAYREALCWSFDGQPLSSENCAQDLITGAMSGDRVVRIPVIPGNTVGISVDPAVADAGWYPLVGTQRLTDRPLTTTYYRFTYPGLQQIPAAGIPLQVVADKGGETVGLWLFQLVPAEGVT